MSLHEVIYGGSCKTCHLYWSYGNHNNDYMKGISLETVRVSCIEHSTEKEHLVEFGITCGYIDRYENYYKGSRVRGLQRVITEVLSFFKRVSSKPVCRENTWN